MQKWRQHQLLPDMTLKTARTRLSPLIPEPVAPFLQALGCNTVVLVPLNAALEPLQAPLPGVSDGSYHCRQSFCWLHVFPHFQHIEDLASSQGWRGALII